jgi:DNA polymerase
MSKAAEKLNRIQSQVIHCKKCSLHKTRQNAVFGESDYQAGIMIIGEAPGANEDKQGRPFVGRAGRLLDEILEKYDMNREKGVFISNIVKCRPPENRLPKKNEIETCIPYLEKQIELINPEVIVLLGLTAARSFMGLKEQMKEIRGKEMEKDGKKVMVTYHPAAILRNPNLRPFLEKDIEKVSTY